MKQERTLKEQINVLKLENADLKATIDKVETEVEKLKMENINLETEKSDLHEKVEEQTGAELGQAQYKIGLQNMLMSSSCKASLRSSSIEVILH